MQIKAFILVLLSTVAAIEVQKRMRNGSPVHNYGHRYAVKFNYAVSDASWGLGILQEIQSCTATVLSPRVLVTAAHCFEFWTTLQYSAEIIVRKHPTSWDILSLFHRVVNTAHTETIEFDRTDVYIHPNYISPALLIRDNETATKYSILETYNKSTDLAVIYLKESRKITFFKEKDFLRFPNKTGEIPLRFEWADSFGFGLKCRTSNCNEFQEYYETVPQESEIQIGIDYDSYENHMQYFVGGGKTYLITESYPLNPFIRGPSQGDSGGPLVCHEERGQIIAIPGEPFEESFLCGINTGGVSTHPHDAAFWLNVTVPKVRAFIEPFLADVVVPPVKPMWRKNSSPGKGPDRSLYIDTISNNRKG